MSPILMDSEAPSRILTEPDHLFDYSPNDRNQQHMVRDGNQDALDESSLESRNSAHVRSCEQEVSFRIVAAGSTRGRDKLFNSDGYSYVLKRTTAVATTRRCSIKRKDLICHATVKQTGDKFESQGIHIYEPKIEEEIIVSVGARAKDEAAKQSFKAGSDIAFEQIKKCSENRMPYPPMHAALE